MYDGNYIMHQYGSMLCIHVLMMCIKHQYSLCIRHQYGSMLCIKHRYGTIWLNAVQALFYGLMMCIMHRNVAQMQTVHYYVSVRLDAVHP